MRISKLVVAAFAALSAASLQAQYFDPMVQPTGTRPPFWDTRSSDNGTGCNIGYILTGQVTPSSPASVCNNNQLISGFVAPWTTTSVGTGWFAHGKADVDKSVGFGFVSGSAGATVKYWGGIAGATPLRKLAIRAVSSGTILHIFDQAVSSSWTFVVGSGFLWDVGIATYTPASAVPNFFSWTGAKPNQFAVFGDGAYGSSSASCGSSCWVGAEDVVGSTGDYDYNDGLLQIRGASTVVPEPSSILLIASGLIGLGITARRRKSANA